MRAGGHAGSDGDDGAASTTCTICLDDVAGDAAELPCAHQFCYDCIRRWSQQSNSCPLCKRRFRRLRRMTLRGDGRRALRGRSERVAAAELRGEEDPTASDSLLAAAMAEEEEDGEEEWYPRPHARHMGGAIAAAMRVAMAAAAEAAGMPGGLIDGYEYDGFIVGDEVEEDEWDADWAAGVEMEDEQSGRDRRVRRRSQRLSDRARRLAERRRRRRRREEVVVVDEEYEEVDDSDYHPMDCVDEDEDSSDVGEDDVEAVHAAQWPCSVCTLLNDADCHACVMCGSSRLLAVVEDVEGVEGVEDVEDDEDDVEYVCEEEEDTSSSAMEVEEVIVVSDDDEDSAEQHNSPLLCPSSPIIHSTTSDAACVVPETPESERGQPLPLPVRRSPRLLPSDAVVIAETPSPRVRRTSPPPPPSRTASSTPSTFRRRRLRSRRRL
eukprot:PLAT15916.1.p1 GENE.PLAT15916.1~~PLAT15916.1.p1  ORF type:complete len:437 (+),score=143.20 PLAT15916.1:137-1447(+)